MASSAKPGEFRDRARLEAERYGPDPWVFVRELLQNARDAGASRVRFSVSVDAGLARVSCVDDGEGMTYEHARRYLFSLYASSKESRRDQVGRFGVGFWSVLRFDPQRIVIRSRPRDAPAWEMVLDGGLERAARRTPEMEAGTEIVLERAAGDGQLARRIRDAAHQSARFLCARDDPSRPLVVTINGEAINAAFELPAPSASFRRGRVRGVVGLGSAARVELFSRGLRVRSASSLDEFLSASGRHTDRSRVQFTELPGRIAPQALLESDAIELVLSRSDARESPALRRLIRLAQRELTRLVNRQIDAIRPLPWYLRAPHAIAGALRNSLVWRMLTASVIGAVIAFGLGWWMWGEHIAATIGVGGPAIAVAGPGSYVGQDSGRYRDLADFYRGPQVDVLDSEGASIAMRYTPPDSGIHFAALIIEHLDADGTPRTQLRRDELAPYINSPCADDSCVQIELDLDAPPGLMRLPVPTGHRVDLASVRLGDRPHSVLESIHGEAVLELAKATRETLRYTAGPATPPRPPPTLDPDPLPRELRKAAEAQRDKPVAARIDALVALVRARVRYSTEPEIQARHREARSRGQGFVERTLEIGAGDCDMQNGVLAALLKHAKVPARLAVGYIGREGRTSPWLHAWVEYRDGAGPWRIADASESSAPPALVTPELQGVGEGPDGPVVTAEDTGAPTTYAELPEGTGASAPPDEPAAAVEGAAEPAPEGGALARALRSPPVWAGSGVALLLLLLLARQSTRRQIAVDREQDLAGLLQGALQQPDAFRAMPAVFQRPLIPLADGKAISLDRARALAATGALLRTGRRVSGVDGTTHLTADAIAGGATVLDDTSPEGQAVADALGAIDLDEWDGLLADARTTPLLDAVNHHFVTSGERWRVLASQALSVPLKSIDLAQLRLRRAPLRGKRVVLVDERSLWLADCDALLTESPKLAVFSAIEVIVERLDLAPEQRARLLSELAGDAIREAARRGGVA